MERARGMRASGGITTSGGRRVFSSGAILVYTRRLGRRI